MRVHALKLYELWKSHCLNAFIYCISDGDSARRLNRQHNGSVTRQLVRWNGCGMEWVLGVGWLLWSVRVFWGSFWGWNHVGGSGNGEEFDIILFEFCFGEFIMKSKERSHSAIWHLAFGRCCREPVRTVKTQSLWRTIERHFCGIWTSCRITES